MFPPKGIFNPDSMINACFIHDLLFMYDFITPCYFYFSDSANFCTRLLTFNRDNQANIENLIDSSNEHNCRRLKIKPGYYDKMICKILEEDASAIQKIDDAYFVECFLHGLNDTVLHILNHNPQLGRTHFSKRYSEKVKDKHNSITRNPLVKHNFAASQEVVMKDLEVCHRQIATNIEEENTQGENILHILIREGYGFATRYVINRFAKEKIQKLCFSTDETGMSPLISALSKDSIDEEDLLQQMWTLMVDSNKKELMNVITQSDSRKNNIFHLCATYQKHKLFSQIAECIWSDEKPIIKETVDALFKPNPDGKIPFLLLRDERVIVSLLKKLQEKEIELGIDLKREFVERKTKKGNTSLNLYAKKDFKNVIDWIMSYMPDDKLKNLLLQPNEQDNNPPMVCVVYNRNDILKRYLMFLFSTKHITKSEIERFMHQRNVYDETILSLVLQHESTLLLPQMLLLDKEKEIHSHGSKKETMLDLTGCLQENDLRSAEVANTISRVNDSYEKITIRDKFKTIVKILFLTFAIPITIQGMDMFFDGLVALSFYEKAMDESGNITEVNITSVLQNSCLVNVTDRLSHIPEKLEYIPRLYYSLSFIIIPWIFYFVEFCMSRYFKETKEKVSMSLNILHYSA